MSQMTREEFPVHFGRQAFGPRDTARAGDVWRAAQDAAVAASAARGWPPSRYRTECCAFVIRGIRGFHDGEVRFGDVVTARTWVSAFRREMFSSRRVDLFVEGRRVFSGVQEWVHVAMPGMSIARASPELAASFGVADGAAWMEPEWPELSPREPSDAMEFQAWHVVMDPLDHMNHPAYVDVADEVVARVLASEGEAPSAWAPVAEDVVWRSAIRGGDLVTGAVLASQRDGTTGWWRVELRVGERRVAEVRLARRRVG